MAVYKNVASQKIPVYAYDAINDAGKTGDAGNITAQISKDGAATAATDDTNPTELDATDAPGVYLFDMTQAETNANVIVLSAVSSTSDVYIEPVIIYTLPGDGTALAADMIEISGDSTAADNLEDDYDQALRPITLQKYLGPRGPGVYYDDAAGNTNTVLGTDGTFDNPVSSFAAANTLVGSLGAARFYIMNGSTLTLGAACVDYEFVGIGDSYEQVVALNSQNVKDSAIYMCRITGTQGGTDDGMIYESILDGLIDFNSETYNSRLRTGLTPKTNTYSTLTNCYSRGNVDVTFTASAVLYFLNYTGDLTVKSLVSTNTFVMSGRGTAIIDSSCSGGTVYIYGSITVTDNSAGAVTIVQTGALNQTNFMNWLGTGTWITQQPWNPAWAPYIEAESEDALADYGAAKASQLTAATAAGTAVNTISSVITLRPFDTFSVPITGLGSLTGYTEIYFAVKETAGDSDNDALILISIGTGMERVAKQAAASALDGSITIDNMANGDITVAIVDPTNGTGPLDGYEGTHVVAVKAIYSDGTVTTLGYGNNFRIAQEYIDAVS